MSRHAARAGDGTAWLVADGAQPAGFHCYWYTGPAEDHLVERAHLSTEPGLLESFVMEGKPPRSVTVIKIDSVYFQCARAIMRSDLWNPAKHVDPKSIPSAGQMLSAVTAARVGGEEYDRVWPLRAKETMW